MAPAPLLKYFERYPPEDDEDITAVASSTNASTTSLNGRDISSTEPIKEEDGEEDEDEEEDVMSGFEEVNLFDGLLSGLSPIIHFHF